MTVIINLNEHSQYSQTSIFNDIYLNIQQFNSLPLFDKKLVTGRQFEGRRLSGVLKGH